MRARRVDGNYGQVGFGSVIGLATSNYLYPHYLNAESGNCDDD